MTLLAASTLVSLALGALGAALIWNGPPIRSQRVAWMRSPTWALVLFGAAALWFISKLWNLGEADFKSLRVPLILIFAVAGVGAFFCVRELLAVRGAAALTLLAAEPLLAAAYLQNDFPQRLPMVTTVYVLIALAVIFGAQPWRLRNLVTWVDQQAQGPTWLGRGLAGWAMVLLILGFTMIA